MYPGLFLCWMATVPVSPVSPLCLLPTFLRRWQPPSHGKKGCSPSPCRWWWNRLALCPLLISRWHFFHPGGYQALVWWGPDTGFHSVHLRASQQALVAGYCLHLETLPTASIRDASGCWTASQPETMHYFIHPLTLARKAPPWPRCWAEQMRQGGAREGRCVLNHAPETEGLCTEDQEVSNTERGRCCGLLIRIIRSSVLI